MTKRDLELLLDSEQYAVLDIETTGFSYKDGAKIIEICIYKLNNNGDIIATYSQLINPEYEISEKITNITGITNEMIKNKPTIQNVVDIIREFIENCTIVAHNAQFDWDKFIYPQFREYYGIPIEKDTVCTLEWSKLIVQSNNKKLGTVYKTLTGKEVSNAHRAEGDVQMTVEIFNKLRNFIKDNRTRMENYIAKNNVR